MSIAKQLTGMRGVYLVAAELCRLGFIASPTSRSAIGADILATDQACSRAYSIQVKTNAKTFGFWLLSEKARTMVAPNHVYVFVNIRDGKETVEFYIVPSAVLAEKMVSGFSKTGEMSQWHQFNLSDAKPFQNNWALFGSASASSILESLDDQQEQETTLRYSMNQAKGLAQENPY